MNVSKLCTFLERQNNAIFISNHEESDRWMDDPTSVMFVNNQNHLMRIDQKGAKTAIPWEQARGEIALHIRKHPQGYATVASFVTEPQRLLQLGAQWQCHDIGGTQPPILVLVVGLSALLGIGFLIFSTREKKSAPTSKNV